MKDATKLADRLVMKLLGTAVESQAEALLELRRVQEKSSRQSDAHRKDHVHILAYKIALQTVMESGELWLHATEEKKARLWSDSVEKAVAKLRVKGTTVEDRHIPKLKQTVDLGRIDDVPHLEERTPRGCEEGGAVLLAREDILVRARTIHSARFADDVSRAEARGKVEALLSLIGMSREEFLESEGSVSFMEARVLVPKEFPKEVWKAFHKVWTFAVGRPGYDKKFFQDLEARLLQMNREEPPIEAGHRNAALFQFATSLEFAEKSKDEARVELMAMNAARCRPPLPEEELDAILGMVYLPKAAG